MSSNKHDIIIDRTNYEEYFLLYIDGELPQQQASAVEAFAALHPDLHEELSSLLSTKLKAEPILFEGKQQMFANNMKMNFIEESLLLYTDNELPANEKKAIDQQMKGDVALQLQHQVLQKAKFDATDKIIYPYKAELYHTIPKAIRPIFWLRIAAAILLILSIGLLWWTTANNKIEPAIAVQGTPAIKVPSTNVGNKASVRDTKNPAIENNTKEIIQKAPINKAETDNIAKKKIIIPPQPAPLRPLENKKEDVAKLAVEEPVIDKKINNIETLERPQQKLNNQAVTTDAIAAYTIIEAPANSSMVNFAMVTTGNEKDKKGSVRGFLRKATRFIERRTGVNPTNEDDELLIGAIAIKL